MGHIFHLFPINLTHKVAPDVGLNPGMVSSACVLHNKEFPSIRQREFKMWRDIMCSLCSTASFLIFSERNAIEGFRELPQVCSKLVECIDVILLALSVNTRKLFVQVWGNLGRTWIWGVTTNQEWCPFLHCVQVNWHLIFFLSRYP